MQVAAAKGLVAGAFSVLRNDGSELEFSTGLEVGNSDTSLNEFNFLKFQGVLIPNVKEIQGVKFLDVKWILAIEKEVTCYYIYSDQQVNQDKGNISNSCNSSILERINGR